MSKEWKCKECEADNYVCDCRIVTDWLDEIAELKKENGKLKFGYDQLARLLNDGSTITASIKGEVKCVESGLTGLLIMGNYKKETE